MEVLVPRTKLYAGELGPIIVLECVCGLAMPYPGHPDTRPAIECGGCGCVWRLAKSERVMEVQRVRGA